MAFGSDIIPVDTIYATASSNSGDPTFSVVNAVDDDVDTIWGSVSETPAWYKWDGNEGGSTTWTVNQYTLTARNDALIESTPKDWKLQASNVASPVDSTEADWTTLDTQTGQTFTLGEKKTYNSFTGGTNTTAYRWYRWRITDNDTGAHNIMVVAEWELMEDEAPNLPNSVTSLSATSDATGVDLDFTTPATDGSHDLATSYKVYSSNLTNGTYNEITGGDLSDGQAAESPHTIRVVESGAGADEVNDALLTDFSVTAPTSESATDDLEGQIDISWTVGVVVDGTERFFRVVAVNDGGDSAQEPVSTGVSGARTDTVSATELYLDNNGSNVATGGTATASDVFGGQLASYAFDENITTYWDGAGEPVWLKYQLSSGLVVQKYSMYLEGGSFVPVDWTFEGSNNDSDWDILDTISNADGIVLNEFSDYYFTNATSYLYYRINASIAGATSTRIYEMEMMVGGISLLDGNATSPYEDTGLGDDVTRNYTLRTKTTSGAFSVFTDTITGSTVNTFTVSVTNALDFDETPSTTLDIPVSASETMDLAESQIDNIEYLAFVTSVVDLDESTIGKIAINGSVVESIDLAESDSSSADHPASITNSIALLQVAVGDKGGEIFVFVANQWTIGQSPTSAVGIIVNTAVNFILTQTADYEQLDILKTVENTIGFSETASMMRETIGSVLSQIVLQALTFEASNFELSVVNAFNLSTDTAGKIEIQKAVANTLGLSSSEDVTAEVIASAVGGIVIEAVLGDLVEIKETLANTINFLQSYTGLRDVLATVSLDFQIGQSTSEGQILTPVITITLPRRKTTFKVNKTEGR